MVNNYWCENSAPLTHFYNGLSVLFPAWEELFCTIVEANKKDVKCPVLLQEMDKFIKQETSHANAHHAHNTRIDEVAEEQLQRNRTAVLGRKPNNQVIVGAMVSIEHFASTMSYDFIKRYSDKTDREYKLFLWHSAEEIEHKDLAYSLWKYKHYDDSVLPKIAKQNIKYCLTFALKYVYDKCKQDKILHKPSTWLGFARLAKRIVFNFMPRYSSIFTKHFTP